MRKKTTLNRGIATLALSASLFLGCQDFLSEDKSVQSAKTSSEENAQPVQEASPQDKAGAEPATPPAVPDNAAECKEIYAQMQTAMQSSQDMLYMELKNKFGSLNCDITKFSTPFVPPDSATVCKNLRATLAILDPASLKYAGYVQEIATHCTP